MQSLVTFFKLKQVSQWVKLKARLRKDKKKAFKDVPTLFVRNRLHIKPHQIACIPPKSLPEGTLICNL